MASNSAIVGILRALLTAETAQFETAMKRTAESARVLSRDFKQIGTQLTQVGTALTKTLTLPILAAGAALIKIGSDFDKASDQIRSSTGATGKDLDKLNASFKAVFATVPDSVDNVAAAVSDLFVRTGQTGKGLEALTTQMLNLSRVANTDIGPLTAAATRAFGDWSIATNKQSESLDFLFKTSQATGIGVTRLTELVVQFGAPLRALGFSFEEGAALMGKWEKEGVNLETVLSGLRFALGNFAKAGKEPAQALKEVQQAILAAKNESEATGIAFQTFGKRAAVDMSRAIIEGRFNIDELVKSLKNSKESINAAAKDTLSLSERFTLLRNSASVALEPLSKPLMTALENAVTAAQPLILALGSVAKAFASLPPFVHATVIGIGAAVAAIGPLLFGLGQLITSTGQVIAAFTKKGIAARALGASNDALAASNVRLGASFKAMLPFIGAVAAALAGLAIAFEIQSRAAKQYTDQFDTLSEVEAEIAKREAEIARLRQDPDARREAAVIREHLEALKVKRDILKQIADEQAKVNAAVPEFDFQGPKPSGDSAKRTFVESLRQANEQIRNEIKNTKLSVGELTKMLAEDEAAFKKVAGTMGLSAEAVQFLEQQLQKQKKTTTESTKATNELNKEVDEQRQKLEALGIVTKDKVNKDFHELNQLWSRAVAEGVPLEAVVRLLGPAYQDLADKAKKSNVELKELNETIALQKRLAPTPKLDSLTLIGGGTESLLKVGVALSNITAESLGVTRQAVIMKGAYEAFGLKSRDELQRTARELRQYYNDLVASGKASASDLIAAREKVLEAERAAAGETVSLWKTEIAPAITDVIGHLASAVNGLFSQMLLGAKGFKAGFIDILKSLASAAVNALNSVLSTFSNQLFKGLTSALSGKGFGNAFSGLIGGALGAGGTAAAIPGLATSTINAGGGFAGGFGAVGGGLSGAALATLTAGIGAAVVAGFALYNRQNNVTAKSREEFAKQSGFANLGALYKQLQTMGPRGAELANQGLNVIGRKDVEANQQWMKDVSAFMDTVKNFANIVSSSTGNIAAGFTSKVSGLFQKQTADQIKAYDEQIDAARDNADEVKRLEDEKAAFIKRTNTDIVANTQTEFDRLSRIMLGAYNAARAQGQSPVEAIMTVGSAIDSLKASADQFGFAGNAAYEQLLRWRDLTTANAPLLDQVAGLTDLMKVLSDTGGLNKEMFADLQAQGLETYNSLIEAGFSEAEARAAIKPLIQEEIRLAKEKGFEIDKATAAIYKQMLANGELKEDEKSLIDVFKEGFGALLKFLKVDLPAGWRETAKAAGDAAEETRLKWGALKIRIPVEYEAGEFPSAPGFIPSPGVVAPGAQHGGIFTRPQIIGIGEHGPEAAIPLDRLREFGVGGTGGAFTGNPFVIENKVYLDGRAIAVNQMKHLKPAAKRVGVRPI